MADPKILYDIVANAEGGGEIDRLAASLEKLDQAIDPAAAARAQELSAELQRLGAQQTAIARFQDLEAATQKAAADLATADAAVAALTAEIQASGTATTAQAGRLQQLGAAALAARNDVQAQTAALDASRGKLAALGIDANNAAAAEAALGASTKTINTELQALGTSLQGVNARALVDDLKQLGAQQQGIQQLRDLGAATDKAKDSLTRAETALQTYEQRLAGVAAPTTAQVNQQQRLTYAVADAQKAFDQQSAVLQTAGAKLSLLGVDTNNLATAEQQLRTAAQATVQQIQQLGAQQAAVQRFQELAAATERARSALATADSALETFRAAVVSTQAPTAAEATELARLTTAARAAQVAVQAQSLAQAQAGTALRAAGVDTDKLVTSQSRASQQAAAAAAGANQVANAYRQEGAAAAAAAAEQAAAAQKGATALEGIKSQISGIASLGVAGILGSQTVQLLKGVAETADAYDNLRARIKLVTGDGAPLQQAFEGVYQVAVRTNSTLEGTGTLFARIARAGQEIGVSQADALKLTESINQAIQISGGSAESADAAVTQLIQGLQSGVLRGDEFNSVMEQAPRLAQAFAAGLGVTTGELRKLANEGELTSATVIRALQGQSAVLTKEFQTLPATVGRAVTNLRTEWERLVGTFNDSKGATSVVAEGINKIASNLDNIARLATEAGAALLAALAIKGAAALRALTAEASLATLTMNALFTSISKIPTYVNIAIAVTGFEVGFKIGEMLRENSSLARQFGVAVTEYLTGVVNELQFVKEAAAAVFTSDTIAAAFDRYKVRAEDMRVNFQGLYEDAKKSPDEVRAATEAAAESARGLGAGAAQAGQQISAAAIGAAGSYGGLTAAASTAGATVQQVGAGASTAGAQIAAGGATGAAGLKPVVEGAKEAQAAILDMATAAKVQIPTIGATAAEQVKILVDVANKSRIAATIIQNELPAAIGKLSGAGLEQFRTAFTNAMQSAIGESQRLAASLEEGSYKQRGALADISRQTAMLSQGLADLGVRAAQSLGVDVASASSKVSKEFQSSLADLNGLIAAMPALRTAGVDAATVVAQALSKMIDGAKSQAEIDAILARLNSLGAQGVLGPNVVAGALKLAADKAQELKEKSEDAIPGVQSLGEAARKAGVDIGELTTGVSKSFRDSVVDVDNLAAAIKKSGVSAEIAGPQLQKAIDQRIAAAQTKQELELVAKSLQGLSDKGQAAGINVGAALANIKQKAAELSPVLIQARADAERLGVTLKDNIQGGADAGVNGAISAYERLKSSGKASAAELQQAFVAMANETIKADGGIVSDWIKVEAATRGAMISVNEYGQAVVSASATAVGAINQQIQAAQSLSASWDAANKSARAAQDAKNAADKANPLYSTPIDDSVKVDLSSRLTSGGLTANDLALAQANLAAAKANAAAMNASLKSSASSYDHSGIVDVNNSLRTAQEVYDQVAELAKKATGKSNSSTGAPSVSAPAPAPVASAPSVSRVGPSSVSAVGSTVHAVSITINGQQTGTVNTASANDAANLVGMLNVLQSSARSAGFA